MEFYNGHQKSTMANRKERRIANRNKKANPTSAETNTQVVPKVVPAAPKALAFKLSSPIKTASDKKVIAESSKATKIVPIVEGLNTGYVVELRKDGGKMLYFKVLTSHPTTGEDITALAYKPTFEPSLGAKVQFKLEPYFEKWSAKDVSVVEDTTIITPYMEQIANVEVEVPEASENCLFPSQIVGMLLKSDKRTNSLVHDLGFTQLLGRVVGGSKLRFA